MFLNFLVKSIIRINIRFQEHLKVILIVLYQKFRKKHSNARPEGKNPIQVELSIKKVHNMRIAYLKLERTNNISHSFSLLWKQLLQFSENYELPSKGCQYVSLTLDYPLIRLRSTAVFMVGVTLPQSFETPKRLWHVWNFFGRICHLFVSKDYTTS